MPTAKIWENNGIDIREQDLLLKVVLTFIVFMNTFIRQKAEETDRQADKQTNSDNRIEIKQYKRND